MSGNPKCPICDRYLKIGEGGWVCYGGFRAVTHERYALSREVQSRETPRVRPDLT